MGNVHSKFIIIGAGLSGLTSAQHLLKNGEQDFQILEGRNQIGGRISTQNSIDLGATWLQSNHHFLQQLMIDLKVETFEQYNKDKSILIYSSMAPPHYFENNSNEPSAYRVVDGSIALINALAHSFNTSIALKTKVMAISDEDEKLVLRTTNMTYSCEKLIVTIPPKLASSIVYEPKLPDHVTQAMIQTHTWMSNAIKVGLVFTTPFWRNKGLSGTIISQISPVIELYDHCDKNQTAYSLMGFVNEVLRDASFEDRKKQILEYLEKNLGPEVRDYIHYHEKDWSIDAYTSNEHLKSVYMSPRYGNPLFQQLYLQQKMLFSGTETSQIHGGYMEGAVYSGINAVNKLLKNN